MRIAYILTWNLAHNDGVTRKVFQQVQEWRELGREVEIFYSWDSEGKDAKGANFFQKDLIWNSPIGILKNNKTYSLLCNSVMEYKPDVVYLRWEFHKKSIMKLMSKIPTVMEINTHIEGEFKRRSRDNFKDKLRYIYYLLTYKGFNKKCAGIVSVTKEILEIGGYKEIGKPTCYIPNSIPIDENFSVSNFSGKDDNIPRLVFIFSGLRPWHGLDNIVELAKGSIGELNFDLITGFDAQDLELPPNVKVYPFLEKNEFLDIFKTAVAGIGSAGLYEKQMNEACAIKVREYLAAGLPVIIPYKDTAFVDNNLPEWVLELPNQKGSLIKSKEKIINFVRLMRGKRLSSKEVMPYVGSKYWESKRLEFMKEVVTRSQNEF